MPTATLEIRNSIIFTFYDTLGKMAWNLWRSKNQKLKWVNKLLTLLYQRMLLDGSALVPIKAATFLSHDYYTFMIDTT